MPNDPDPSVPSLPSDKRNVIDAFLREILLRLPSCLAREGVCSLPSMPRRAASPLGTAPAEWQADMFRRQASAIGGLDVQLVYYRGRDEFRASQWVSQPERLAALMERIDCRTGITQIGKVIAHAKRATQT